eukprot:617586-Prymnesium_polylepis.1
MATSARAARSRLTLISSARRSVTSARPAAGLGAAPAASWREPRQKRHALVGLSSHRALSRSICNRTDR